MLYLTREEVVRNCGSGEVDPPRALSLLARSIMARKSILVAIHIALSAAFAFTAAAQTPPPAPTSLGTRNGGQATRPSSYFPAAANVLASKPTARA